MDARRKVKQGRFLEVGLQRAGEVLERHDLIYVKTAFCPTYTEASAAPTLLFWGSFRDKKDTARPVSSPQKQQCGLVLFKPGKVEKVRVLPKDPVILKVPGGARGRGKKGCFALNLTQNASPSRRIPFIEFLVLHLVLPSSPV
jgi:hypothetical protein